MIEVEYFNELDERWSETWSPIMPTKYLSEAERFAKHMSTKNRRTYRVRKGVEIKSQWKGGQELGKEKWI